MQAKKYFTPNPPVNCSFSTVDRRGCCRQETHYSDSLPGILDTYGSGYMGLGYGHCLLRRRWAGIGSQPAYIFHSHGNGPPRPSLAPRGGNVPGHGSSRGNFLPGDDANTPVLPWEDHGAALPVIRGSQPQMDGACSHQTDGTQPANHLLALRAARTLRRTGYTGGPDWSDQLTATYFPRQLRHPLTLGLQPTFVMSVSKLTIFSGPQSCGGLNYWPCHPSTKSNPASHWVIVHGDMASQRARCGQISSFVAFAIHVNGGKDKLLHESAQFCRQGSHWRVSYAI